MNAGAIGRSPLASRSRSRLRSASTRTTATWDAASGEWVIEGEKIFITYAESCDAVLVLARLVHPERRGLSAFMVEKGTPGLSVGRQFRKMGIRFEDTAPLAFSACRVPAFNHIEGDLKSMLRSFSESRPVVAAYALGVTRAALDFTWERLSQIGITPDYEKGPTETTAAADRLMSLEAEWEATWVVVLQAKWIEQNEGPGKIGSSMAKAMGGGLARRVTQTCIDVLGVCGLSDVYRVEKAFRDAQDLRHLRGDRRGATPDYRARNPWLFAEGAQLNARDASE